MLWRGGEGHAGWGGLPEEGDFGGGEAVGFVDQVAELALELQDLGGLLAGGEKDSFVKFYDQVARDAQGVNWTLPDTCI